MWWLLLQTLQQGLAELAKASAERRPHRGGVSHVAHHSCHRARLPWLTRSLSLAVLVGLALPPTYGDVWKERDPVPVGDLLLLQLGDV